MSNIKDVREFLLSHFSHLTKDGQVELNSMVLELDQGSLTKKECNSSNTNAETPIEVPEEYDGPLGIWVSIDLVKRFILRTRPDIEDIDNKNVILLVEGKNYEFINHSNFMVLHGS